MLAKVNEKQLARQRKSLQRIESAVKVQHVPFRLIARLSKNARRTTRTRVEQQRGSFILADRRWLALVNRRA